MSRRSLPRVSTLARERIAREFDHRGPETCLAEIIDDLRRSNPELLDMAVRCAADLGDSRRLMFGFAMFYRLLGRQSTGSAETDGLSPLPRVTTATRDAIVKHIDAGDAESFTVGAIADLENGNPELLRLAHDFASRHADYLGVMQGFALLYRSLVLQSAMDRTYHH